jgi:succinoglycan biosynthesis transport protein ExoP
MREISPIFSQRAIQAEAAEPEYIYAQATEEVHLRDYWKIFIKRRRLVALAFLVALGVGAYVNFTATNMYTATAMLKIEPQNPSVTGLADILKVTEGGSLTYDYYQTQFKLLESRSLAAKVITELKLDSNDSFTGPSITSSNVVSRFTSLIGNLQYLISRAASLVTVSSKTTQKVQDTPAQTSKTQLDGLDKGLDVKPSLVERYVRFLKVNPIKNTRLVEIRFTTPDPALSQMLANAHAGGFIRMNLETRFDMTKEARAFLDAKNSDLKEKLERSEGALNRFRQAHGVVSMEKGENIVVDRLVEVNRQLTAARAQRIGAESLYKIVENKPSQYLSEVVTQGLVPIIRENLVKLEAERVKLSTIFKADHPRMLELNQQINEARRSLNAEIANVVRGIEGTFAAARVKEQALQAEAQKQQQIALNLKEVGVEYAVLEEEVKVNRALYENVLNRLHETNISNDLALSNMQVIQPAERPSSPSSPDVPFNLALSAFAGLFLGVGMIFFLEYVDSSLSTPRHVWRAIGLRTFGVVPDLNSLNPRLLGPSRQSGHGRISRLPHLRLPSLSPLPQKLIVSHHPLSVVTESYRTIRTALLFSQAEKLPQVILFTSPSLGEGKSVTALNLGIALAQGGYKVLVVDADLRKGSCHTLLGLRNHRGLSNVLTGDLTLQDGIQETSVSGLSLLSRGICPRDPTDLLGSNKMKEVVSSLRESFNFILIDSPPAIAVSDAAVLSVISDGVFLVFHGQKTTTASARQAVERMDAVRAPLLGVILNRIDLGDPDYAYYRSYYGSDYGLVEPNNGNNHDDNHDGAIEAIGGRELEEAELWKTPSGSGTVPREFLEHMTSRFTEAVGPMAPLVVRDHVALLGESMEAFPKSRLQELLQNICDEILDQNLRRNFQSSLQEDFISLRLGSDPKSTSSDPSAGN